MVTCTLLSPFSKKQARLRPPPFTPLMRQLMTLLLITSILQTQANANSCMSSALINVKLAAYAVRALAYGVPRNAVWCVHRAVRAERFQHITVGKKQIECMSSKRFTTVIGSSLPNCVGRFGGAITTQQHRQHGPVSISETELVRTSERSVTQMVDFQLPFTNRRTCQQDQWCHCYCNSGCHYCCSSAGVGLPGTPSTLCFEKIGCFQKRLQVCPK